MAGKRQRFDDWPQTFPEWLASLVDDPPNISTYHITEAPNSLSNSVDRILFVRSLHHLNRFDPEVLDQAAKESFRLLKAGGIVGVVQHRAPTANSLEWGDGSNGYLHTARVVAAFENAGLKLIASSEINANGRDRPTENDKVWRLPPTLSGDDEQKRQAAINIGESDRMTLKFQK